MAMALVGLNDGYRRVLADFLGEHATPVLARPLGKHPLATIKAGDVPDTLKKLDALDARRRDIEANVKPDVFVP
jgi:hypothetical protein